MNRPTLVLVIVLPALWIGWRHASELRRWRAEASELEQRRSAEASELEGLEARLSELRRVHDRALSERSATVGRMAQLGRDLATPPPGDPDARWSTPPDVLPSWNPDSPYLWLEKSVFPLFRVPAFTPNGELAPPFASVLTVDPVRLKALNTVLRNLQTEYRTAERERIELSDDHLGQIRDQPGRKRTVRVAPLPEVAGRVREELGKALVSHLGQQRADLIQAVSAGWISENYPETITSPRTVSVLVRDDGSYRIESRNGFGSMSSGGTGDFLTSIPPELRSFFESWRE